MQAVRLAVMPVERHEDTLAEQPAVIAAGRLAASVAALPVAVGADLPAAAAADSMGVVAATGVAVTGKA
jgi:hypothetical protein